METEVRKSNNEAELPVSSAQPMTPLEMNAVRLDANRTVLTPDYLEKLKSNN